MNLSALHQFTLKYGGPWKLLLLSMRGGQLLGGILALATYAWLISVLRSHGLSVLGGVVAVEAIGVYVTLYTIAQHPATWYCLDAAWFGWASVAGDAVGIAGSIAVAVLTRGSAADCGGVFANGERRAVGSSDASEACKLQKVVFATGITNSLMFLVTLLIHAWLVFRPQGSKASGDAVEALEKDVAARRSPSRELEEA